MSSVGRNIEIAIQSMLKVSEEVADIQALVNNAKNDLNMLETLFSVSKYIGLNPQQHVMMSVLEDSIKGVFGATYCNVIFEKDKSHLSNSKELYPYLDYERLKNEVTDLMTVDDLSESDICNMDKGSLVIIRLSVGDELYGFLACYWTFRNNMSESSFLFLQIIANQVSMFLKSNILIEEFKNLAVNDSLTGIYNRSYFINFEENSIPQLQESIIMFDIDHFKSINDSMGHQFGDKVLVEFAKILTAVIEKHNGTAFRYGGEEFIIKCNGGEKTAIAITEDVLREFRENMGYTCSAGISTLGSSCKIASYSRMVSQADSALYVSKETGRNKYTVSSGDIQVLKEAADSLTRMLSKIYRNHTTPSLFRAMTRDEFVITEGQFEKLCQGIGGMGRLYDEIYITDSLDIMFIFDDLVQEKMFRERFYRKLSEEQKEYGFELYSLEQVLSETIIHSSRVSELGQILAANMGLESENVNKIRLAAEWHDLGKLCIDPLVYGKNGKLSDEEYEVIKLHTWLSYLIAFNNISLGEFAHWILFHHEDFDGSGYYKLSGKDIPLEAQIISIVDKYDALTEDRCYRPAFSWEKALGILTEEQRKFDTLLFGHFKDMVVQLMGNDSSS